MSEFLFHLYTGMNIVSGAAMSVFAILFIVLHVPQKDVLHNYVICRRLLSAIYIQYSVFCFVEYFMRDFGATSDYRYTRYINVTSCSYAAILIYFALVTILDSKFFRIKKLLPELLFPTVLTTILLFSLVYPYDSMLEEAIYYLYCVFYIYQCIRFAFKLFAKARWAKAQMDNYFSNEESSYVDSVRSLFLFVFIVGILNIAVFLIDSYLLATIIGICSAVLLFVLGVRYLNYVFILVKVSPIVSQEQAVEITEVVETESYWELDNVIKLWLLKKTYLKPGITIQDVAVEINTNRTYLSNYINSEKGVNFSNWINTLRIDEAKQLMLEQPELSLLAICEHVGYTDISTFSRNFSKCEKISPTSWRKSHLQ